MMVDLSGYAEKTVLLAVIGKEEWIGLVYVNDDIGDSRPHLAVYRFNYHWVKDDGKNNVDQQIVHRIICEVGEFGCIERGPSSDVGRPDDVPRSTEPRLIPLMAPHLSQQLLDNLFAQNAALTKIIDYYMAVRGCN